MDCANFPGGVGGGGTNFPVARVADSAIVFEVKVA